MTNQITVFVITIIILIYIIMQDYIIPQSHACQNKLGYTVNREYFVSKIFHAIIFRVKSFSDK